jgi:flagellar biogenesis protein FliO
MDPIPYKPAEDLLTLAGPAMLVLVAVLALAAGAALILRRSGRFAAARAPRRLRLVERLTLSRRAALLLVEVDGRPLLLGESGERLSRLDAPCAPVAADAAERP